MQGLAGKRLWVRICKESLYRRVVVAWKCTGHVGMHVGAVDYGVSYVTHFGAWWYVIRGV
jgi:hypothetical protein